MPAHREDRIRVVLVDDNATLRAGLRALTSSCDEIDVVAESRRRAAAVAAIARKRPDVVVVGVDEDGGLDCLEALRDALGPACRLLVVTRAQDPALHYQILCHGAMGIVPKEQLAETLVTAILELHAGRAWVGAAIMANALAHVDASPRDVIDGDVLTRREREIVALVSRGLRNPGIAERLFLSEGTVRNHLTVIFRKLGVNDRYGLIARWHGKQ